MQRSSLLATLALTTGCHVRPESFLPAGASAHPAGSDKLTGTPASFVVFGDARSFVWPALLQEMLDTHAQGDLYEVANASVAEADARSTPTHVPVADLPEPRAALCLVSLAGVGDEQGPVKGEHDMVGAEMGADALERLALELHAAGFARVVFATPVFTASAGPGLALEHLAIERLLARGHAFIEAGPDVLRASKRYYPDAYLPGGEEPNEFGQKLLAEEWYRWLAGPDAREEVVQALYATDFDVDGLRAAHGSNLPLSTP